MTTGVRPLLRWAGSKRQIVPTLAQYWHDHYLRYVEPFAGSACLFFHIMPAAAVLGDVNRELIATYRCVRDLYPEVSAVLRRLRRSKRRYYELRAVDPERLQRVERAARFIYLNRYCFNGLYRTNQEGRFNVPYGGKGTGSLPSELDLQRISQLLNSAALIDADFEHVLSGVKEGDFVYMDPPFSVSDRRVFREYDPSAFSTADVLRLRLWLERLSDMRIPFVVSYVESDEAERLSRGFNTSVVCVRRSISGFAASRARCRELLISNVVQTAA